MRIVVQRVGSARVSWLDGATEPTGAGLLCLVGFRQGDAGPVLEPMAQKLLHLRIFEDATGRMNRSLVDTGGELVLVPQFTLYADCRKGRRPSFTDALQPEAAQALFEGFTARCRELGVRVHSGRFGAHMQVALVNDGPVTLLLDSKELGLERP